MPSVIFAMALLVGSLAPARAQTMPPPGQWAELPRTNVSAAADPRFYVSGPQAHYNVRDLFANSGGDVATWKGKVGYFLSGGGHAATPDNSLFWVPLDGSGAQRILGPYYNDCGTTPACDYQYKIGGSTDYPYPDGRPITPSLYAPFGVWTDVIRSMHSGSCIIYAEKLGKPVVFMFAAGAYTGPGNRMTEGRWVDLSLTFDQQMARPDMGWQRTSRPPDSGSAAPCAWDPIKKQIVVKMRRSVGAYFPDEDRWEKWPIAIDGSSDYQSAMALDVAGRWMYVLGDGVAQRYHLDEKRAEDLRNRPWGGGTTAAFGARAFGGGYASIGMAWHPRTRQIVMVLYGSPWVDQRPGIGDGSKAVYLIDPATDKVSFVHMGGKVPADPGIFGMYGRFRVVPGTDAIVSVYLADRSASIGTIPFAQAVQIAPIIPNQGQTPPPPRTVLPLPLSAPSLQIRGTP